ncbi:hypothetical protein K8R03_03755 [Candidatus Kaiserbacteria bacterium]|nr:hypothetical protein [Candidatus Kaiserbacteria bacterium]
MPEFQVAGIDDAKFSRCPAVAVACNADAEVPIREAHQTRTLYRHPVHCGKRLQPFPLQVRNAVYTTIGYDALLPEHRKQSVVSHYLKVHFFLPMMPEGTDKERLYIAYIYSNVNIYADPVHPLFTPCLLGCQ